MCWSRGSSAGAGRSPARWTGFTPSGPSSPWRGFVTEWRRSPEPACRDGSKTSSGQQKSIRFFWLALTARLASGGRRLIRFLGRARGYRLAPSGRDCEFCEICGTESLKAYPSPTSENRRALRGKADRPRKRRPPLPDTQTIDGFGSPSHPERINWPLLDADTTFWVSELLEAERIRVNGSGMRTRATSRSSEGQQAAEASMPDGTASSAPEADPSEDRASHNNRARAASPQQ